MLETFVIDYDEEPTYRGLLVLLKSTFWSCASFSQHFEIWVVFRKFSIFSRSFNIVYSANTNMSSDGSQVEKNANAHETLAGRGAGELVRAGEHLHRGLSSRQVTMIAIGGAIGTGLIIGT